MSIYSKEFKGNIKVHAIQTGMISVKKAHYEYTGNGILRIPQILFGKTFMPEMPVWVWCIETPHGNYLIDTGETSYFYELDHFKNKSENYVNRKILKVNTNKDQNIDNQLKKIGLSTNEIDAVILTHLHYDHVDGIRFFEKSEFFIPKTDWEKPYGAPLSIFPKWFKGHFDNFEKNEVPFLKSYDFSKEIKIISTPGHTLGHQSVLLQVEDFHILFAGDMTFTEQQLLENKFGGIHFDLKTSRKTIENVLNFGKTVNLIFLPSHDPESANRLLKLKSLNSRNVF
jgi:N-acyl homoserine lactone hydrolase